MIVRYFIIAASVILLCALCFIAGGAHMLLTVEKRFSVDCAAGNTAACTGGQQLNREWF